MLLQGGRGQVETGEQVIEGVWGQVGEYEGICWMDGEWQCRGYYIGFKYARHAHFSIS